MTVRILQGDCRETLPTLPDQSVHMCVTSPPYFGLRSYLPEEHPLKNLEMGQEQTPEAFVAGMVEVFREVRRVLRDDGTLWLNIGDSYAGARAGPQGETGQMADRSVAAARCREITPVVRGKRGAKRWGGGNLPHGNGIKKKDLIGIPWMLAFALRADGWYLRQEVIWHKPNPMPESVADRCTKAHESLFLLSKSPRYYFDTDAIADPVADSSLARWGQRGIAEQAGSDRVPGKTNGAMKAVGGSQRPQARRAMEIAQEAGLTDAHIAAIRAVGITDTGKAQVTQNGCGKNDPAVQALADQAKAALGGYYREFLIADRRNKRSVWTVPTMPFKEAHFATFPPALIEPCILAGSPIGGVVLDPFGGSGTTGMVANRLQRSAILCELHPDYPDMARARISRDAGLFADIAA